MFLYSFLLKWGRFVDLVRISVVVNAPGAVDNPTVNSLALLIPVTRNVPLKPELPTPVVLLALFAFTISTNDPTDKSWGKSVIIFAVSVDELCEAPAINLKFLCWPTFVRFSLSK